MASIGSGTQWDCEAVAPEDIRRLAALVAATLERGNVNLARGNYTGTECQWLARSGAPVSSGRANSMRAGDGQRTLACL